jgi:hypothetical protein
MTTEPNNGSILNAREADPVQIVESCLWAPDQPAAYRRLAGTTLHDRSRLARLGRWLCALGSARPALAIFRLLVHGPGVEPAAAAERRHLALTLSRARLRGEATGIATARLSAYWTLQNDPEARVALIDLLIWRTSLDLSTASVTRLLNVIEGHELTVPQLLATAKITTKVGNDASVRYTEALLANEQPTPGDGLAEAQRRGFASLHLWAIFRTGGARALLDFGGRAKDPMLRDIYHEGFESLCRFAVGDIGSALASRTNVDRTHGLIFNGISLYPDPVEMAPKLEAIQVERAVPDDLAAATSLCVVLSCDAKYLRRYGPFFASNFAPATDVGCEVVFFVVGEIDADLRRRIALLCPVEVHFVADTSGRVDTAYHTINRFVRVPGILNAYDLVVISDIDARLDLSQSRFLDDVRGAAAGWVISTNEVPWLRNLAGFVFFTKTRHDGFS